MFAVKELIEFFPVMCVSAFLEQYPDAKQVLAPVVHHMFNTETRDSWDSETRGKQFFAWVCKARGQEGFPEGLERDIRIRVNEQGDFSMLLY
jgi:hypothetical protein